MCPYTAVLEQLDAEKKAALAAADADAEIRRRNESAVVIQSAVRGLMKRVAYARITAASRLINRVGRGHVARANMGGKFRAALLIQSHIRGHAARRRAKATTQDKATCHCGRVASGKAAQRTLSCSTSPPFRDNGILG